MAFLFKLGLLLGVALIAPIDLPAGGALEKNATYITRSSKSSPVIACENCLLKVSPFENAPSLREINNGTPLKILRTFDSLDGQIWLHVQMPCLETFKECGFAKRGWINV